MGAIGVFPSTGAVNYTSAVPIAVPAQSNGLTLTGNAAGFGTPGAWVEVVAASAITTDYVIFGPTTVEKPAAGNGFDLEIGQGALGLETVRGTVGIGGADGTKPYTLSYLTVGLLFPANARCAARVRAGGGAVSLTMVRFLAYPIPL